MHFNTDDKTAVCFQSELRSLNRHETNAGGQAKGLGVSQSPGCHWADNTCVHRVEEWLIQRNYCVLIHLFFSMHLKGKSQFSLLL